MSEPVEHPALEGAGNAPANAPPLAYETPASNWKRFWSGAFIGASHAAAFLFTFLFWFIVPLLVYAVIAAVDVYRAAFSGQADDLPPFMMPVVWLVWMIVGLIGCAVGSAVLACMAMAMGIAADAFRRRMRWPLWVMPLCVAAINVAVWTLVFLPFGASARDGARLGIMVGGAITLLFLFYWVVLFFTEQALLLIKWMFGSIWAAISKWWRGEPKLKEFPPHEEGI